MLVESFCPHGPQKASVMMKAAASVCRRSNHNEDAQSGYGSDVTRSHISTSTTNKTLRPQQKAQKNPTHLQE
ncbi:hypothetical protein C0081_01710 [Cohaesibacter celericrescens]|uniref:Uncharacterized protein n=1 Tax=Cohaesibacter celericrescens TaxID=2067669 RepID=A0A2N5XWW3_9HYPH|nr:hypothetical protein C0081_01710 [Cohaesibacter celericrescens]